LVENRVVLKKTRSNAAVKKFYQLQAVIAFQQTRENPVKVEGHALIT